ncbi:MAG TPA: methyltransferase domain-containing protein [Bacteroidales bacterium]|nr:methyltransferase domain-containing protein [Bacteroidales bacterium]
MEIDPMTLYGLALSDFFNGNQDAKVIMHRDDNTSFELPMNIFFHGRGFSFIEEEALELCRGKVLDVGAGSGRHSLYLKQKGLDVFSIDISPEATEIMKKQGLSKVKCSNIFDFHEGKYDSIILLGHGIGMTGSLEGFRIFLGHMEKLLRP